LPARIIGLAMSGDGTKIFAAGYSAGTQAFGTNGIYVSVDEGGSWVRGTQPTNFTWVTCVSDGSRAFGVDLYRNFWTGGQITNYWNTVGNLAGAAGSAIDLQCVGSNQFRVVQYSGPGTLYASTTITAPQSALDAKVNRTGDTMTGALTDWAGFVGDGSGLTALNPAYLVSGMAGINISGNAATATTAMNLSGNVSDAQLSANVALRGSANSFTTTNTFAGVLLATNQANLIAGTFTGNVLGNVSGAAGTASSFTGSLAGDVTGTQGATVVATVGGQTAAMVAAGTTAANAATSAATANALVKRDSAGNFTAGTITANLAGNAATAVLAANVVAGISITNAFITNSVFAGNGSGLTNLNAGQLTGVVPLAHLPGFLLTNAAAGVTLAGTFTGTLNGNASTATSAITAATANNFSGPLAGDVTGTQGAIVVAAVGGQTAANIAAGASAANAATSTATANAVVKRDASGNFSAGIITANLAGSATLAINVVAGISITNAFITNSVFAGNGSGLTNLNASQLTGVVALAQLPGLLLTNAAAGVTLAGTFTGTLNGNAATATSAITAETANNFSGSLVGDVTGTQDATVVSSVGGLVATNIASGASAANAATSANTAGSIVKRDASGNFSAGTATLNGDLYLPGTTASAGIIYSGGSPLIQSYGTQNFFAGSGAGNLTMSGAYNAGVGYTALQKNTSGNFNTAIGDQALYSNTNGNQNTANGYDALYSNTSGQENTACGFEALLLNTSGSNNIALGYQAGWLNTGNSNIDIGNVGVASDNNIIRIGSGQTRTFIAGSMQMSGNVVMNDNDIQFRNDSYHGVGWYGGGKLFAGVNVNGPVLYGGSGGGLGCTGNGNNLVLVWNSSGNVGIGTTSPGYPLTMSSGAYCSSAGVWTSVSDRNSKEAFTAINPRAVLEKVSALPITEWKYKVEADGTEHIGPMAQDFHAAFGLNGNDDKHISTVDEGGVALAAIQGLNQKVNEKDAKIQEQAAEIADLKLRLEKLEQLVTEKLGGAK
jgi:hypothetical protein